MRLALISLLVLLASGIGTHGQDSVELFADDFSRFPPGVLSAPIGQLNGAIQEYHYIEHCRVRTFPWRNPIVHLDSWAAGDEIAAAATPYLEPLGAGELARRRRSSRCSQETCARADDRRAAPALVLFPDDGHPDLASAVRDVTGDQRDGVPARVGGATITLAA